MCIGTRYLDKSASEFQSTFMRRFGSNIITTFIKIFAGKKITDPTSGFRAANIKVITEFAKNYPTEYPEPESTVSLLVNGYNVTEVPVSMNERTGGVSSIRLWKSVDYMVKVVLAIIVDSISFRKKRGINNANTIKNSINCNSFIIYFLYIKSCKKEKYENWIFNILDNNRNIINYCIINSKFSRKHFRDFRI